MLRSRALRRVIDGVQRAGAAARPAPWSRLSRTGRNWYSTSRYTCAGVDEDEREPIEAEFVDVEPGAHEMWEEREPAESGWLGDLPSNLELDDPDILLPVEEVAVPMSDPLGARLAVPVRSFVDGVDIDEIVLENSVFGVPLRVDIVHRVVEWQRAKRRKTLYRTKRLGDIRGSGRKLHRQKGTGSARQGESRNAHMRGGVKAHGPVFRDWSHDLPKKIRKLGLRTTLSSKRRDGRLVVVDSLDGLEVPQTKALLEILRRHETGSEGKGFDRVPATLVATDDELSELFRRASSNIRSLCVLPEPHANVLDIVRREHLLVTRSAVDALTERLRPE